MTSSMKYCLLTFKLNCGIIYIVNKKGINNYGKCEVLFTTFGLKNDFAETLKDCYDLVKSTKDEVCYIRNE